MWIPLKKLAFKHVRCASMVMLFLFVVLGLLKKKCSYSLEMSSYDFKTRDYKNREVIFAQPPPTLPLALNRKLYSLS